MLHVVEVKVAIYFVRKVKSDLFVRMYMEVVGLAGLLALIYELGADLILLLRFRLSG